MVIRANLSTLHREAMRRRILVAVRISLSTGGWIDRDLIADVCDQLGLHGFAFRQMFPTDEDLTDAVHEMLLTECVERLQTGVDRFPPTTSIERYISAARALAETSPLESGGMIIRAQHKLRALANRADGTKVIAAERQFVGVLLGVLIDLMSKIGREFAWSPALAVRLILDTYERSFAAWLLDGKRESEFSRSPYIQRTLPTLLEQLTRTPSQGRLGAI